MSAEMLRRAALRGAICVAVFAATGDAGRLAIVEAASAGMHGSSRNPDRDWPIYGGSPANDHYSSLRQINRKNVAGLKKAWQFDSAEAGGLQTSPLIVGRVLYGFTPTQKVIALDAATGRLLWKFDSGIEGHQPDRGLSYWSDGKDTRLFAGVMNFLYALDPATGKPVASFGEGGRIDLRKNLDAVDYTRQAVAMTSPGAIYKDMIIVGFRTSEVPPAPHGDIRAFDVRTGKLRWSFHTIPHPGEAGYETWPPDAWKSAGSANNWAGMTVDVARGIVYAPTGSAVPDFYGGARLGEDLYANTLLALDANTGKRIWHFQGVHHDMWDRDFDSPPTLLTVTHNGKRVDAVEQSSKQGFVYLFDRATGAPLFPIAEKPYPPSTVPGEKSSATQPLPLEPKPFARQLLTEDELTNRTPQAHAWAVQQFRTFRSEGQFVPLGLDKQTVVFPGFDGGAEWGGTAADPKTGVIYVNANDVAWTGGLTPNTSRAGSGSATYLNECAVCHGDNRAGSPPALPSLIDIYSWLSTQQIVDTIHGGKGRMPAYPGIRDAQLTRLLLYLRTGKDAAAGAVSEVTMAAVETPENLQPMSVVGARVYQRNCAICHGDDRSGNEPGFPALARVGTRLSSHQLTSIIREGKDRMPGFPRSKISEDGMNALLLYLGMDPVLDPTLGPALGTVQNAALTKAAPAQAGSDKSDKQEMVWDGEGEAEGPPSRYRFTGYRKFLDPDGYPAVAPPWGTLSAIDMNTGKYLWKIPLGEYLELAKLGMDKTGSENYGGPIVTAGGLVFIGATMFDRKIRAFDSSTGKLLWQAELPYAGTATPATYSIDGRQYVVIAAGGGRDPKSGSGGVYVAFALP
ncbi:c-type cytochrome [Acidicapsa ligni]|uniref:c-type cytochrome n=1 Tax=Acidicapsa ligni TaxID=542300 RepID=UPI0021E095C8|nr:c-type cytochrome [Acidicapsa ligni]